MVGQSGSVDIFVHCKWSLQWFFAVIPKSTITVCYSFLKIYIATFCKCRLLIFRHGKDICYLLAWRWILLLSFLFSISPRPLLWPILDNNSIIVNPFYFHLFALKFFEAFAEIIVIWIPADLLRVMDWCYHVGIGFLLLVLGEDVLLCYIDIIVLGSILLFELVLVILLALAAGDEPDCDQVVEDYYYHQVQRQHVESSQLLLLRDAQPSCSQRNYWKQHIDEADIMYGS